MPKESWLERGLGGSTAWKADKSASLYLFLVCIYFKVETNRRIGLNLRKETKTNKNAVDQS